MLFNASGCLDALTAPEVARLFDTYVTKTVTPLPRGGNASVRIAETEHGLLNSIGLANPGIDVFAAETLPRLYALLGPVWVSVGGFNVRDYVSICERLEREEVAVLELNLSCPNVEEAPESAAEIVAACRAAAAKPIFAKLSPALADLGEAARAVEAAGADGLSLVNTLHGLELDQRTLRPRLERATGGYSGPPLKPIALAAVWTCRRATALPIVGMGGVASGRDALDLLAAGAAAVALGTVLFGEPNAPARVRAELDSLLAGHGFADAAAAVGAAHDAIFPPSTLSIQQTTKRLQIA